MITVLIAALTFGVVGCTPPRTDDTSTPAITVSVDSTAATISEGESVTFTANVEGTDDKSVLWSVSDPVTLRISEDGIVEVLKAPTVLDKLVTVTATSKVNDKSKGTKTIRVLAPRRSGQVGYLTSQMIDDISGDNLTVGGTVTDIVINQKIGSTTEKVYESTVKMDTDKWSGSWNAQNSTNVIVDTYKKGDKNNVKYTEINPSTGESEQLSDGHSVEKAYITRKNTVGSKMLTDYRSFPVAWEAQHYWNHIKGFYSLITDAHISYNPDVPSEYTFTVDNKSSEELFFMSYLTQSLTPMLDPGAEYFESVTFKLDDNHEKIKSIVALTVPEYTGAVTNQAGEVTSYNTMSYSKVALDISDIGSTAIADLTAYEAPMHADKLEAAIAQMQNATSYKFNAVVNSSYEATPDDDDYSGSYESARKLNAAAADAPSYTFNGDPYNYRSDKGIVGSEGWVTDKAILVAKTDKYSSSMDDMLYHTEYSAYLQFDGYYEEAEYYSKTVESSTVKGLKGTKRVKSNISDALPDFDFSANVFEFVGSSTTGSGRTLYTFKLREPTITQDIAEQSSMDSYADSAISDSSNVVQIVVDDNGNFVSVSYPFDITMRAGTCKITYSNIGSTTINMDKLNANYVARGEMATWDLYEMKYYRDSNGDYVWNDDHSLIIYPAADVAIKDMYGGVEVPAPTVFMEIFGDNFSGPFFDDKTVTKDDGTTEYIRYMSLKAQSTEHDENRQISNFDELHKKMDEVFTKNGFSIDGATDVTGGSSGLSDRVMVYTGKDITIKVSNNFTTYFDIEIMKTADFNK